MHDRLGVDQIDQVSTRSDAEAHWPWLDIHWVNQPPAEGCYMSWEADGLHLKSVAFDPRSSVHVDFVNGAQARRLRAVTGEALTRAIGCQKGLRPSVFDATAGLGGDATVLANVGCAVCAFERQPDTAALLADGLRRAVEAGLHWPHHLRFRHADACDWLAQITHGVIYLDPMFPKERKAAPQLAMQILHELGESTESSAVLFERAMDSSAARVVVKRPLKAPYLGETPPASEIRGKTVRFDLYPRRKLTDSECASWESVR
jgi:16S rRNA (guanine1516-N2)-methyltransferase